MKAKKDTQAFIRCTPEWLERIDDWRRKQAVKRKADISRSEAIRELVNKGLDKQ